MLCRKHCLHRLRRKLPSSPNFHFTPEQIEAYTTVGGTPHLDGEYTVFGEVVDGMDIVDKIQQVKTDRSDRPEEDVKIIKVSVIRISMLQDQQAYSGQWAEAGPCAGRPVPRW